MVRLMAPMASSAAVRATVASRHVRWLTSGTAYPQHTYLLSVLYLLTRPRSGYSMGGTISLPTRRGRHHAQRKPREKSFEVVCRNRRNERLVKDTAKNLRICFINSTNANYKWCTCVFLSSQPLKTLKKKLSSVKRKKQSPRFAPNVLLYGNKYFMFVSATSVAEASATPPGSFTRRSHETPEAGWVEGIAFR